MWIEEGQKIEVQGMEDGFYGVWFPTTFLKRFLEKCFMIYDEFVNENENSKHSHEMVQISQLQPILPNINNKSWVNNDVVEVYEFNCWWVEKIIQPLPCETKYVVYFLESSQEM
ncbi:hypothetical protein CY35_07G087100 [Sphagnum magellanicum]|uniref:Uncharacterized protein n=1 Tax=Sphagnum magellanicum TaxID=128215 RepID=A0ACB8HMN0_9BRYO|nr:hypothetical protein CY35_07G087100 [Sphagnum magellanicum]